MQLIQTVPEIGRVEHTERFVSVSWLLWIDYITKADQLMSSMPPSFCFTERYQQGRKDYAT